ncbi:MAG: amidase, partial [Ramlibacter sp.]
STDRFEARASFDAYCAQLGARAPVASLKQVVDSRTASPGVQQAMEMEMAIEDALNHPDYKDGMLAREKLRQAVVARMAQLRLDAIMYPLQRVLVAPAGEAEQPERNGVLSHGTGFPAVTFPGGFSEPTATAPIGVPVGAELLGRDFSEALLLSLAFSFEQIAHVRKPPASTPPLR